MVLDATGQRSEAISVADALGKTLAISVVHPSAAETTAGQTADQDVSGYRRATLIVDLTAFTGTSVQFFIEGKDATSAKYFTIAQSAAETAAKTVVFVLDEQSTALPSPPSGQEYVQGHPFGVQLVRLRWAGTFSSATFSSTFYLSPNGA